MYPQRHNPQDLTPYHPQKVYFRGHPIRHANVFGVSYRMMKYLPKYTLLVVAANFPDPRGILSFFMRNNESSV